MGFFGKLFKSDEFSTSNKEIINAHKALQDSSLSEGERTAALAKLKSLFFTSGDKDDLKAVAQAVLRAVRPDESVALREAALKTLDAIVENCLFVHNDHNHPLHAGARVKLGVLSEHAMPVLMQIAEHRSEDTKDLRRTALATAAKLAPFAINDECINFLARNLNDKAEDIRTAVISAFENLLRVSDESQKRRIARFSVPALCEALDDAALWVRASRVLAGLEKFALGAAPFLYKKLDDKDGEWAAAALRKVTGEQYGKEEKGKWEQWLKKAVIE